MAATDFHMPVAPREAQRIIEQLVQQSLAHLRETVGEESSKTRGRFIELENEAQTSGHTTVQWPKISEFADEHIGIKKINEYIEKLLLNDNFLVKEWKTAPGGHDLCWLYAIDFIEKRSLEFNNLYIYRVRYSIPTRRSPIPRQTVCIYFTIDVSKVRPKHHPVKVLFAFETMSIIHQPNEFRFRQTWIEDIVLLKEKMARGIDF
ncbi:unnamed protein product [Adineta ricciae]|uniref:A-kinase anchor protein 14 n=1 Tax=Adineta ricciae TaxID=249248 RepID=A0A815F6S7_ADIRI|nr:unnamed protein product [Adineta ricciae]